MVLRRLSDDDLPSLLTIEQMVQQSPWSRQIFIDRLVSADCQGWGLWIAEQLVAFVFFSSDAAGEAHLFNLCVLPDFRRQGFATLLLQHAVSTVRQAGATVMYLEVRRSNFAALALYENYGFSRMGERRNYYPAPGGGEDAILCAMEIGVI